MSFFVLFSSLAITVTSSAAATSTERTTTATATHADTDRLDDVLRGLDHSGTPVLPTRTSTSSPVTAPPGEKRTAPNYAGREAPATDAGDVLIWGPRILFAPVWLVTEFVLRRPLMFTVTHLEENHVVDRFVDALSFLDGDLTLFPRFLADFGMRPSVGLSVLWNDFLTDRTALGINGSFWGPRWLSFSGDLSTRALRNDTGMLSVIPEFILRPDYPFYGFGAQTRRGDERFFQARHGRVRTQLRGWLDGLSRATFGLGYSDTTFLDEADTPALDLASASTPEVSFESYRWMAAHALLELDTREPEVEFSPGSGVRAELFGTLGLDPTETSRRSLRFSAELAAFWDISSVHHVVSFAIYASMLRRLGGGPIPVTELVNMGGAEQMRSFLPGRFVGESAWSVAFSYRWPVWILLDAEVFAELGNAYQGVFEGFTFERTYLGWGVGLRSNWSREVVLSLLVGFGTDRLDEADLKPGLTRFTLNISRGF